MVSFGSRVCQAAGAAGVHDMKVVDLRGLFLVAFFLASIYAKRRRPIYDRLSA
jgi:hypothetical protein